jgi:hypothetical protein
MNRSRSLFILYLVMYNLTATSQKNNQEPEPYLPLIMGNFPNVRDVAIYKNEVYFTLQSYQEEFSSILCIKKDKNKWTDAKVVSFSGRYNDLEPFIAEDGLRLYFASNRPLDSLRKEAKDYDIWYVERKTINDPWTQPINLGEPVNTKYNEFYPSLSTNKNIYYTSDRPDSKGSDDIFFCTYTNGTYGYPSPLGDSVNTSGFEFNAFIAPDESYIIYTGYNRKNGFGSGDLYMSFKDHKGNWGTSKNLGETINSNRMDYCPFVDIQTHTLYFTSRRNAVKTYFDQPQSLDQLLKEFTIYENGLSRLYQVSIKDLLQ